MLYVVIGFLFLFLFLYILLGGIAFGAGIMELFSSSKSRGPASKLTAKTLGWNWELNHIWLLLSVLIIWIAFPEVYRTLAKHLLIPFSLLCLGICMRITSIFYHKKNGHEAKWSNLFRNVNTYSSLSIAFFFGICIGALFAGNFTREPGALYDYYFATWFSPFPVSVGIFTVGASGLLSAVYMIGETLSIRHLSFFQRKANHFLVFSLLAGALVFGSSLWDRMDLLGKVARHYPTMMVLILSTVLLPFTFLLINRKHKIGTRLLAFSQVGFILFSLIYAYFPNVILYKDGVHLSLVKHHATLNHIQWTGFFLIAGTILCLLGRFVYVKRQKKINQEVLTQ